jgi:hypothetical protein
MKKQGVTSSDTPRAYTGFDGQYINGSWRLGRQGGKLKDTDPYSGETVAEMDWAESGRRATTDPRAVACSPSTRLGSVCGYSIILKPRRPRVRFRSSSRPQLIQVLRQRLQTCECIV